MRFNCLAGGFLRTVVTTVASYAQADIVGDLYGIGAEGMRAEVFRGTAMEQCNLEPPFRGSASGALTGQ